METLQDLLPEIERLGNREAVLWTNGYRTVVSTYSDLYARIGAVTEYFRENGLRKGEKVLIWAENRMEWLAVFWACVASGVIAVPVDFRFSADLVRRIEGESQAKLTIDAASLDRMASLPRTGAIQRSPIIPDDIVEIVYTSGTTGEPAGVAHRHRHICANLRPFQTEIDKYKKWARPFQPVRILDLLPLSHMFGQALGAYIPLLLGGSVAFTSEIHPAKIIQMAREHRITVLAAVPQILGNLRNEVERKFTIAPRVDSIWSRIWRHRKIHSAFGWKFWALVAGGAPLDPELEEFWGRLGFLLIQGYGLTEASPVVTVNHPFDVKRGSLGKPLPGLDVKIAPDGEILVRGPSITADEGAWLYTGDLGEMDAEGRLYYRGRKKDTIVTADGLNVFPEDIERVLNGLPEIRESAVLGVPAAGGEEIHAALILNKDGADLDSLVRQVNSQLESHQKIKSWSLWPDRDFPRTASTLKIRRAEIRQKIAGGRAPNIDPKPKERELSAMSSLERVELLSELENTYQLELNEDEFAGLQSRRELEEWLKQRRPAPASSGWPPSDWARSLPVRAARTAFQELLAIPLFKYLLPLTVNGLEHLEGLEPPVIFAANHTSHLDTPAVYAALPRAWRRRLAPAMGLDVFRAYFHPDQFPSRQAWPAGLGYFLSLTLFNAYPLPQDVAGVRRALSYTGELIKRGYCPLVFPEGARTPDGELHPFRPGIGMMAIRLQMPVVPISIEGLYDIYSIHDSWPKRGAVRVVFGKPRQFARQTYEEVAVELHQAIQDLR